MTVADQVDQVRIFVDAAIKCWNESNTLYIGSAPGVRMEWQIVKEQWVNDVGYALAHIPMDPITTILTEERERAIEDCARIAESGDYVGATGNQIATMIRSGRSSVVRT